MGSGGRKTIVVEVSPGRPPSDSVDDDGLDEHDAARWRGPGRASGCSTDEDAPRHESETEDDGTLGSRTPGFLTEDEDEPAPRVTASCNDLSRFATPGSLARGASTPGGFSRADDDDEPGLVAVARLRRVERAARAAAADPAAPGAPGASGRAAGRVRGHGGDAHGARGRRAAAGRAPRPRGLRGCPSGAAKFTKIFTDADDARDLADRRRRRRSWSLRRVRSRERLEPPRAPSPPLEPRGPMTLFGLTSRLGAVHPNSAFKRRWDYLTSLLAVAVVFAPECRALAGWCLGLEEPRRPPADGPDAGLVAALVNVWFLCDVLLNFVTGYVDGAGVLVMSKRRIAIRYCQTYFLLDIWCALPFDRLVLPYLPVVEDLVATYDAAAPQLPCARGSDKTLLVDCVPRRGPIRRVRNVVRHARNWTPRALQFAKRRGRLRQVLVSAPNIVSYIVKTLRLVRISKVKLVKWRTIAVLGRRYRKNAALYFDRLPSPTGRRSASKEKLLGDIVAAAKRYETPRLQTARRRLKSTSARPAHQRRFSE
ncbi:voltage-gated potassium channel [Aureococcus anophagefferens]|nr:voltage-gated potassium channel [Aureococcus anophagefferens]